MTQAEVNRAVARARGNPATRRWGQPAGWSRSAFLYLSAIEIAGESARLDHDP